MPITDYIPKEKLIEEGYFNANNDEDIRKCNLIRPSELTGVRLTINEIASYLKVGASRVRRYFRENNIFLDPDGKLSIPQIRSLNLSGLTDLTIKGDNQRKRTHFN